MHVGYDDVDEEDEEDAEALAAVCSGITCQPVAPSP